jgi:acetoin utilization protein AcuB
MRIQSAMTREVIWIEPSDELTVAHGLMTGFAIRHLPIMENGRLVGIVSDRDVRAFSTVQDGFLAVPDLAVSEVMTRDVITCPLTATVSDVGEKMLRNKIDCVPVLAEDGTLAGLVTSSDLIQLLIDREESAAKQIPFDFKLVEGSKMQIRNA